LLTIVPNTGSLIVKDALTGKGRSEPYVLTIRAQDLVNDYIQSKTFDSK